MSAPPGVARPRVERREAVLRRLAEERHVWIATADPAADGAHLIPLAFVWDGATLTMATRERSRTVRNLRRSGRARVALGSTADVVIVEGDVTFSVPALDDPRLDATFATLPLDPRRVPGVVCVHLRPDRVMAWASPAEIDDRDLMRDGTWLD